MQAINVLCKNHINLHHSQTVRYTTIRLVTCKNHINLHHSQNVFLSYLANTTCKNHISLHHSQTADCPLSPKISVRTILIYIILKRKQVSQLKRQV